MKKIVVFIAFISTMFGNSYLESIYDNVLIKNTQETLTALEKLHQDLEKKDLAGAKADFKDVVINWKQVQGLYVAAELDEDMIDVPRFIDFYHYANEDITKQLALILESDEDLNIALFKNSYRSINALEFVLFKGEKLTPRGYAMADIIVKNIQSNVDEILTFYKDNRESFITNTQVANSAIINSLIDSAYKLKEWRVGDTAGLSRKYQGSADDSRGEYYISGLSKVAVKAIIELHQDVVAEKDFKNFAVLVKDAGAEKELRIVREALRKAEKSLDMNSDSFKGSEKLFDSLDELYNGYFISLIAALEITSKIVDADGD